MKNRLAISFAAILVGSFVGLPAWGQVPPSRPKLVDVQSYDISIEVDTDRSFLRGKAIVALEVLDETLALPFTLNGQITLLKITDETGERYSMRGDDFARGQVRVQGPDPFRTGDLKTLTFEFEGLLEKEQYAFLDVPSTQKAVIDRNGAALLSEGNWFPSHELANDAALVTVHVTVPLGFTAVGPGQLQPIETLGIQEVFTWRTDGPVNQVPVIVSRYFRQSFELGSIPMTFYVTEDCKQDLEALAQQANQYVEFFSQAFGEPGFQSLTFAQAGNIELGSTGALGLILLDTQLLNAHKMPVVDLASRIAQQWWGFGVRIKTPADAWLRDGFATFGGLLYVQAKTPDDFQVELGRQAVQALKYQDTAPIISGYDLEIGSAKYQSIVASKGAWVLYMLGRMIGPEKLTGLMAQFYRDWAGQDASIADFVKLVRANAEEDYAWFFVQWIESVGVPEFNIEYSVYKLRDGTFKIRGQVQQNLELFKTPMEVRIETKGAPEEKLLSVNGKTTTFTFDTQTMPVKIELDPNGKILMDSDRMRLAVHVAIGEEYLGQAEYVSAIEEFERAIQLNPRSSLAHFRLGETFFQQHSYSNAANSMKDCLNGDLKPEWVETWAHIYLGKVYDILGSRQRAKAEYQKAKNSKIDYNGAQAEAQKYLDEPYTKPSSVIG